MAYLLWLAWRLLRSAALAPPQASALRVTFARAVALQFLNLKAWMLALAIVAGWIAGQPQTWLRFGLVLLVWWVAVSRAT